MFPRYMARRIALVLLAAATTLLSGCAGQPALAPPDYRPVAGKDPRSLAADYMQRRAGKPPLLVGADEYAWEFLLVPGDDLADKGSGSCNKKPGT